VGDERALTGADVINAVPDLARASQLVTYALAGAGAAVILALAALIVAVLK
jgi:hypothetical protein